MGASGAGGSAALRVRHAAQSASACSAAACAEEESGAARSSLDLNQLKRMHRIHDKPSPGNKDVGSSGSSERRKGA